MAFIVPDIKIDFKELISAFTIPTDIKDDLIYCQKSLRSYIKIHQMVVARLGNKLQPQVIRTTLDEIEKEICEISFEQKLLVIRLRQTLEEYYNSIKSDNVEIDRDIGNAYISHQIKLSVENDNFSIEPISVKQRYNEKDLMTKYGLDDSKKSLEPIEMVRVSPSNFGINPKQVSLLKPKSERFAQQNNLTNGNIANKERLSNNNSSNTTVETEQKPVVRTMNISRLNLLQALNKAREQSLCIQTASVTSSSQSSLSSSPEKRNYETHSPQSPSTSDDSLDAPAISANQNDDNNIELNQEAFLRMFRLYTHEYSNLLSQRRSKRRRRNVQSNEKSDFHYGNLDLYERMNKKRKTFLYSPPATRSLKRKKNEKDEKEASASAKNSRTDRSSSSSPDQKLICLECMKSGDIGLSRCEICCCYYHIKCHRWSLSKHPLKVREKLCPQCLLQKSKDLTPEEQNQLRGK